MKLSLEDKVTLGMHHTVPQLSQEKLDIMA